LSPIDHYADHWLSSAPVYLTDMDRCLPASSLASAAGHRKWRVFDYSSDKLAGKLIVAGGETEAPPVRLPLGVRGWHAVSIGAWRLKDWYLDGMSPQLLVRLSGEDTFSILRLPTRPAPADPVGGWHDWTGGEELSECFWKIVDLSDRDLELGQPSWLETSRDGAEITRCAATNAAYVKLVPLTAAEVRSHADDSSRATVPLYAHNDVMMTRSNTPEELCRQIEPFADSDFSRIYWEGAMGDLSYYFTTRNRTPEAPGREDFFNAFAREEATSWRRWRAMGVDPLQVAADATRARGLEFHVCHRLGGFRMAPVHDHWDHGDSLYKQHPEWHGRDHAGHATPRLSFAFPEVRQHVIDTYREMIPYGIDGVCLLYNRRLPLVEYEQPLVDGFQQQHGGDPRQLAVDDPTWLRYRAGVLTTFMRELRESLEVPITAIVMSTQQENLAYGLDPRGWVEAGLVDTLVPYSDLPEWNSTAFSWQDPTTLKPYAELTSGTTCALAPCFHPPAMSAADYRRTAAGLAANGADAFFFWWGDTGSMANYGAPWNAARRLGHMDEVQTWMDHGAALDAPVIPIRTLGGWDCNYVTPA
jgi:hypothetical protein